jgi:hypothetical protein
VDERRGPQPLPHVLGNDGDRDLQRVFSGNLIADHPDWLRELLDHEEKACRALQRLREPVMMLV